MFFGKRIQHYFQFAVLQLSPETICNTSERLRCSIIFTYHSQSPSNGWEPVMGLFCSAFDWHAWGNSPALGGSIVSFAMKTNTGCAMGKKRAKKSQSRCCIVRGGSPGSAGCRGTGRHCGQHTLPVDGGVRGELGIPSVHCVRLLGLCQFSRLFLSASWKGWIKRYFICKGDSKSD